MATNIKDFQRCWGLFLKSVKARVVVGDLFALSSKTVNKLNLDSEDRIHAQLTRINHRPFCPTEMGREGQR